jgi:hypothetical protein
MAAAHAAIVMIVMCHLVFLSRNPWEEALRGGRLERKRIYSRPPASLETRFRRGRDEFPIAGWHAIDTLGRTMHPGSKAGA